jgi:pyroglutamyl-peptidase
MSFQEKGGRSVLLTYFEPFGLYKKNSTMMIARHLREKNTFPQVEYLQLPVVFGKAGQKVVRKMRESHYDFVLGLGMSPRARRLFIERIALNVNHTVFADNAGNRPFAEMINEKGSVAYWTTMPCKRIVEVCRENSVSIKQSFFAGTYVCNNLLYSILDAAHREKINARIGFIHVPSIKTKVKGKQSLEYLAGAIEKILALLVHGDGLDD